MNSPLLALFVRSLREDARGSATYRTRAALGGFLVIVMFLAAASRSWPSAPGLVFFVSLIWLQMLAITFVGLSYFASAITEEKEAQTLGLLRLANLSPLSILLGKSTSRLCGALLLIASQIPFTVIAITLGGISYRQIAAVYCTLGAFTFLLCNLALLGSVLARSTGGAALFCLLMCGLLMVIDDMLELAQAVADHFGAHLSLDAVTTAMWAATPNVRLHEVLAVGFSGPPIGWQVLSNLALGVGCFLLAWAAFERFCDQAPDETAGAMAGWFPFFRRWASRPPRAWKNALAWKDFYFHCGGGRGFALRVLGYGGTLLLAICGKVPGFPADPEQFLFWISLAFSLDVAAMAARIYRRELDERTLPGLGTLPETMPEIAKQKALGYLLAAAPGAVATITAQVLVLIPGWFVPGGSGRSPFWALVISTFGTWISVLMVVHVVAWLSLRMKRGALPLGYVITVVPGLLVFLTIGTIVGAIVGAVGGEPEPLNAVGAIVATLIGFVTIGGICVGVAWILREFCIFRLEDLAAED